MERWAQKVARWRVPVMRRYGPLTRFGIDMRVGVVMPLAIFMLMAVPGAPLVGQAKAADIADLALTLTGKAAALGFTDAGSTIDIEVIDANDGSNANSPEGKTRVTLNIKGIPAALTASAEGVAPAGLSCGVLDKGQALLSAWLLIDPAERAPGILKADGTRTPNHMVERWGPPFPVGPAGPRGGYQGVDTSPAGGTGLGENGACPTANYPMSVGKKGGALEATCFPGHPSIRVTSPLAKSTAGYNSGMGGALAPDPNGFVSDTDGEATVTLKTNFDFTEGEQVVPLVWREAPGVPFFPSGPGPQPFKWLMDEASFMGPFYLRNDAGAPIGPPPNAPGFFGSSVPPFHAQCTNPSVLPAPPPCVLSNGRHSLKSLGSGFKRVYETVPHILHVGPNNGETIPSLVAGIGALGVANSVKDTVETRSFGRGVIHDIDGPCDNNVHRAGAAPCPTDQFGLPGGPPTHPAGSDSVGLELRDGGVPQKGVLPKNARRGHRFQKVDTLGRQVLARGRAVGVGIAIHHDCLTHGLIPGNPEHWTVKYKTPFVDAAGNRVFTPGSTFGPPVADTDSTRTRFPAEFTMIMTATLPGITPGEF